MLATAPDNPLARGKRPVRVDALGDERVMLLDDGHCFRDQVLALCARSGVAESDLRATSLPTLVQMVASGTGVTLLPSLALETENRGGVLALRPLAAPRPGRTLVLAWRKSAPMGATFVPLAQTLAKLHAGVERRAEQAIAHGKRRGTQGRPRNGVMQ